MSSSQHTGRKTAQACAADHAVRTLYDVSGGKARAGIETGKVTVDGRLVTDPREPLEAGAEVVVRMNAASPRARNDLPPEAIVHVDAHVVVVDKPAGISTVPYEGEDEEGTLDARVRRFLAKKEKRGGPRPALGVVHRIDKETSGLVVFTRTWLAKQSLASQFRKHTVHRRYLAIAHGAVRARTIESHLIEDRGDRLRGSIEAMGERGRRIPFDRAQRAVTHVEVVEVLRGATLVACRLETGRTHQIRIHLSEAGHPVVGDRVYVRGFAGPAIAAPRLMLHAAELGFVHPATNLEVRFERPPPRDFEEVLARLRARA